MRILGLTGYTQIKHQISYIHRTTVIELFKIFGKRKVRGK